MDPRRCTAHSKQSGEQCKRWAAPGAFVCAMHGAKIPTAKAKAAQRLAADAASRTYAALAPHAEPVTNPLEALSSLAGDVERWRAFCEQRIADLDDLRYQGVAAEQIHGEVLLFERAMDRCASVLVAIAKLNLDERLASLSERQGALIEQVLTAAFGELELTEEQRAQAPDAIRRALAVVA